MASATGSRSVEAAPAPEAARPTPAWRLALPGMAVGLVLALVGLGRLSLWLDESLSLGATNQLGETLQGTGGTMAAYYAVLTPWTAISEAVWWLRLPSALFAVASLLPLASVARRVGGDRLAVRTCLLAGGAMAFTRYAQEARSYALVMLLTATAMWGAIRAVEEGPGADRRWWRLGILLGVVLVLAHGLALLGVGAVALVLLLVPDDRARAVRGYAPTVLGAGALVAILWSAGADEVGAWVPPIDAHQVRVLAETYSSPAWWAALPLLGLVATGAAVLVRRGGTAHERWLARVPVIWAGGPTAGLIALSLVRPSLLDRYLIGIVPALALLLAVATVAIDERLSRRPAGTVGIAVLIVAGLLVPGQVDVHRRVGDDWRGAAQVVADGARPGDGLVFPQGYHRTPFEAGWQELAGPAVAPDPLDTPRPLGTVRRHDWPRTPAEVDEALADVERVWVVTAHEPGEPGDAVADLLARPAVRARFHVAEQTDLDGTVQVLLLVS